MVRSDLVRYVKEQLAHGYRIQDIRRALEAQYGQKDIEEAIHEVYAPQKSVNKWVFVFVGILILVVLIGVYLIGTTPTLKTDLAVNVQIPKEVTNEIPVEVSLVNSGETRSVTVTITNELIDNEKFVTKREIVEVEKTLTKKTELEVPESVKGSFVVRTTIEYADKRKTFENIVKINSKTTVTSVMEELKPSVSGTVPQTIAKKLPAGITEDIEEIRVLSLTNPKRAIERCQEITQKDECYARIAHATDTRIYCESIQSAEIRDNCYFFFSVEGDEIACKAIIDDGKRDRCTKVVELKKASSK